MPLTRSSATRRCHDPRDRLSALGHGQLVEVTPADLVKQVEAFRLEFRHADFEADHCRIWSHHLTSCNLGKNFPPYHHADRRRPHSSRRIRTRIPADRRRPGSHPQVAPGPRYPVQALVRHRRRHRPLLRRPATRTAEHPHAPHRHRPARRHRRPRAGGWRRVLGPRLRRAQRRPGRRAVLQHGHERLPGDADRRLLRRADHHLHLPAYRQCRRQPRRHGGDQPGRPRPGREAGRHRAVQLARHPAPGRLAAGARPARHRRRRHPRADPAHPRRRPPHRRARLPRRRPFDLAALRAQAQAWPGLEGMDLASRSPAPRATSGPKAPGPSSTASRPRSRPSTTSSRSITAPSATSCAPWPRPAAG